MCAAPLLTWLKDQDPRIKSHNARVLARRSAARSGDVAQRGERRRAAQGKPAIGKQGPEEGPVPDDEVPALAGSSSPTSGAAISPRPGARPTAKRNTNRGGRPGGGSRPSGGGSKRR
jgi:preprotein translocase subunit SecF